MAIEANETHQYQTRPLARAALQQWCEESGADIDDYVTCTAIIGGEIKHGWVVQDVADAENMVKAAEVQFGPLVLTEDDDDRRPLVTFEQVSLMAERGAKLLELEVVDVTKGLLICDMDAPSFDESGDVYLQLGPYLPFAAKAEAVALAKKLKEDVAIVNAAGVTILAISPTGKAKAKADKPQKPAKPLPLGSQVDEFDRPVRPIINQEKWVKTCAGHFQKIEAIAGNAMKLLAYEDSINPGDTYRKIIWLYAKNHRRYAMKYDRSPFTPEATADGWHIVYAANDDTGQMADAAD